MAQSNDEGWERSRLYGVATRMKEPPELEESAHHISDRTRRQSKTLGIARTCPYTWADMGLNHFGAMHGRDSTKFDRGELRFIANDVLQEVQMDYTYRRGAKRDAGADDGCVTNACSARAHLVSDHSVVVREESHYGLAV
jgi:hypothetical protein